MNLASVPLETVLQAYGIQASWLQEQVVTIGERTFYLRTVGDVDSLLLALPPEAEIPYWAILWDSAIWLSEWLWAHPELVKGKQVLELGAGVGLVGLVAQWLGAKQVIQNDAHLPALALCAENARLNALHPPEPLLMDWRHWQHPERYDLVLGADIVYDRALHPSVQTVLEAALRPDGVALIVDPGRDGGWLFAERLLQAGWQVQLSLHHLPGKPKPELLVMEVALAKGTHATRGLESRTP